MLQATTHVDAAPTESSTAFTVEGSIVSSGHAVDHIQYVTDSYVITILGRSTILHSARLGGRFVVDDIERRLRPIDLASQQVQVAHLRELVGTVAVHRDTEPVEQDGFACRRYRLCNDSSRITISAEALCTRIAGIERTALHLERALEAQLHPFALPLDPDEIVVRSTTRTFSQGYQHVQEYHLRSLVPEIGDRDRIERILTFPVVED